MIGSGPSLYGQRQYAQGLYSEHTATVQLADACSASDDLVLTVQAALADSLTSSDGIVAALASALFDAASVADAVLAAALQAGVSDTVGAMDDISSAIAAAFSESIASNDDFAGVNLIELSEALGLSDSFGPNTETVGLTDFVLIKEFISQSLRRSSAGWTQGGTTHRGVTPHIYGRVLYAQNMYSTNIAILWNAVQRSVGPGFTNHDGFRN
jgi:hypothetical protein